jgi:hypothetical protein
MLIYSDVTSNGQDMTGGGMIASTAASGGTTLNSCHNGKGSIILRSVGKSSLLPSHRARMPIMLFFFKV